MNTNRGVEILFREVIRAIGTCADDDCHSADSIANDQVYDIDHPLVVGLALPPRHIRFLIHGGLAGTWVSFRISLSCSVELIGI
jgi:hypothetical protein